MLRASVLGLGSAAILATASTAFAADVYRPAPPPLAPAPIASQPAEFTWTGPYIGALIGYGWSGVDNGIDADGWLGGVYAGFNRQSGNFVFGLEADGVWSGMSGSAGGATADVDWTSSLKARFGHAFGRHLVYGTAGLAVAGAEMSTGGFTDNNTHFGWTAGVGLETQLSERLVSRLEYQYANYGSETYALPAPTSIGFDTHSVRVGLALKF